MRHGIAWVLAVVAMHGQASPPQVEVTFVDAARFADVRDGYTQVPTARAFYLAELGRYIEQRAGARLAAGDRLEVEVTNVHLAGDYRAEFPATTNVRVVREVTPARIDLAFRVYSANATVRQETRRLRSVGYPTGSNPADPLNYEKALIDAWLDDDLPATR